MRYGAVYLADLLSVGICSDEADKQAVAELCGFEFQEKQPEPARVSGKQIVVESLPPAPSPSPVEAAGFRFWRAEGFELMPQEETERIGHTLEDLRAEPPAGEQDMRYEMGRAPLWKCLLRWPRLWPFLKHALGERVRTGSPDIPKTIQMVAQGRPVLRLPLRHRHKWHREVLLLKDGRDELSPFWADYRDLEARLKRMRGKSGLRSAFIVASEESPTGFFIEQETGKSPPVLPGHRYPVFRLPGGEVAVLALGDLGQYESHEWRQPWLSLGRRLRNRGLSPWALCPCPRDRWDSRMARTWRLAEWDSNARLPLGGSGRRPTASVHGSAERAKDLLHVLLSPALRVERGLLRDIRLLAGSEADAGTEYDVFRPFALVLTNLSGFSFPVFHFGRYFPRLVSRECDRLVACIETLRRHHAHAPVFLYRELMDIHDSLPEQLRDILIANGTLVSGSLNAAAVFERAYLHAILEKKQGFDDEAMRRFVGEQIDRWDRKLVSMHPNRQIAWLLTKWQEGGPLPDYIDEGLAQALLTARSLERRHQVCYGEGLSLNVMPGKGRFLLGTLLSRYDSVVIGSDCPPKKILRPWDDPVAISPADLNQEREISLSAIPETLRLTSFTRPPWARRMWYDRFGLAAEFAVARVPFVLRWIPPGRFLMGSPGGEPGRLEWEGPQHEVTIGQGFWLGEAPITQAQWQAVMGENPSYFKGPLDLPVEQVSWQVCEEYCKRLKELVPGLPFYLPTEKQWEYACRAGTETALYSGGITIIGDYNAPELDPIAWYGGNSGQDLEVTNPVKKSEWEKMQYPAWEIGTHRVKLKQANPWGLYDILGNVWEWCSDVWEVDAYQKRLDATETRRATEVDENASRVVRGGSWFNDARGCRAAVRDWFGSGLRGIHLGLRLAAGQEPEAGEPHSAERPSRRMAEGRSLPRDPA